MTTTANAQPPIDGAALLDEVEAFHRRFNVFPTEHAYVAVADRPPGGAHDDPRGNAHQCCAPAARPRGRRASVARRSTKTTMSPESAPMN